MSSGDPEVPSERRRLDEHDAKSGRTGDGQTAPGERLSFGPFVLDPETGRLLEGARVVQLAPRPFETLLFLARHPGRVVSKGELIDRLWAGTFVTEDVLVQSIVDIRRALGDHARTPQFVETIPRRGYRFIHEVRSSESPPVPATPGAEIESAPPAVPPGAAETRRAAPGRERRAFLALALLALAVLGLTFLGASRFWNRQPAGTALPAEPGSLVVLPIVVEEPVAQSGWLRQGLAEMIAAQLGQTPGVSVVARHRLAAALAEAGFDEQRGPAGAAAAKVARSVRAERLVTGSYLRIDQRFVLSAQVIDVATGRIEGSASVRGKHPSDILDAVDSLCLQLVVPLRAAPEGPASEWRPTRLATRSVEASRNYVEAVALLARGGRQAGEAAEARLDEALRLDPAFAQAYLKKAEIQHWRRRWGYGEPDPAPTVRAAAALLNDLPERDRLLVRGFDALLVRQKTATALEDWAALLKQYPSYAQELGVPGLMAETYLLLGRWDLVITVAEASLESPSLSDAERARLASLLAQAYKRRGEFDRALRESTRALQLWPVRDGPAFLRQRTLHGRIALDAGRRSEALAEFEAVAAASDADATNLSDAGWGFYMAGDRERAALLVKRALTLDADYGNAYHLRGWLALGANQLGQAASDLERAFERTPRHFGNPYQGVVGGDLAALYYAGVVRKKQGALAESRADFARLADACRKVQLHTSADDVAGRWQAESFLARVAARQGGPVQEPSRLQGDDATYFVQSARLHALEGQRERALRELAQGLALGHGEWRHIADDPDFETLRADAEFQRLVTPPAER
jgi:DNA-binding winged helix-turn-helix (wHTH) protein/tetratricopeptide (TPR) repeat protein/TolB-like protein